jgi:hypothetical protein
MWRIRSPCCASAASGNAAAPPRSVTNSRRLIAAPRGLPSRESYLVLSTVTRKFGLNTALWMSALGQKQTFAVQNAMSALPPKATSIAAHGMSAKGQKRMRPSYRQDRGAVRQPITDASMVLALPTFRHAPSDHWQRYGIM